MPTPIKTHPSQMKTNGEFSKDPMLEITDENKREANKGLSLLWRTGIANNDMYEAIELAINKRFKALGNTEKI